MNKLENFFYKNIRINNSYGKEMEKIKKLLSIKLDKGEVYDITAEIYEIIRQSEYEGFKCGFEIAKLIK